MSEVFDQRTRNHSMETNPASPTSTCTNICMSRVSNRSLPWLIHAHSKISSSEVLEVTVVPPSARPQPLKSAHCTGHEKNRPTSKTSRDQAATAPASTGARASARSSLSIKWKSILRPSNRSSPTPLVCGKFLSCSGRDHRLLVLWWWRGRWLIFNGTLRRPLCQSCQGILVESCRFRDYFSKLLFFCRCICSIHCCIDASRGSEVSKKIDLSRSTGWSWGSLRGKGQ